MLKLYLIFSATCAALSAALNPLAGLRLLYMVPLSFLSTLIGLIALHLIIVLAVLLLIDNKKPAGDSSRWYRLLIHLTLDLIIPLLGVKIHATGTEKVPKDRRFLLVSNHLHDIDPAVFMYALPSAELGFIGKKEIFAESKYFVVPKVMHVLHGLPIDRESPRNAVVTINTAAEKIKTDTASMAIFPEGYVSLSGELLPFRNGAFKIAKKAGCPIVVATIKNTKQFTKNMFRRRTDIYLDILEVIDAEAVKTGSTAELGNRVHAIMENNLK